MTTRAWLKSNLGPRCCAGLTTTDSLALEAGVALIKLYNHSDERHSHGVLSAYGAAIRCMQPKERFLAYHAIAMDTDWHLRQWIWQKAGLEPLSNLTRCANEPQPREAGGEEEQ